MVQALLLLLFIEETASWRAMEGSLPLTLPRAPQAIHSRCPWQCSVVSRPLPDPEEIKEAMAGR